MIYDNTNNHVLVNALKKEGLVLFNITYARPSYNNGINSGWWIDISPAYGTEYYESHKKFNNEYLGRNIKEAMKKIKNIKSKQ